MFVKHVDFSLESGVLSCWVCVFALILELAKIVLQSYFTHCWIPVSLHVHQYFVLSQFSIFTKQN